MEPNPFTKQGKALLCEVRDIIVDKWLEGSKPFEIAQQFNFPRKTVVNIVQEAFNQELVGTGHEQQERMMLYTEFCKRQRPPPLHVFANLRSLEWLKLGTSIQSSQFDCLICHVIGYFVI